MDQKSHRGLALFQLPGHLSGLLSDPGFSGMFSATGKIHLSRTQVNEKQHIKSFQEQRSNREEIASQDLAFVMCHQMPPTGRTATLWRWWDTMTIQDIGDSILIDLNPQFPQFTFSLAIPPIFILQGQSDGQTLDFLCGARASSLRLLLLGPFSFDQSSMPADYRVGFEDP